MALAAFWFSYEESYIDEMVCGLRNRGKVGGCRAIEDGQIDAKKIERVEGNWR